MKTSREDQWTQRHLEYRDVAEYYGATAQSRAQSRVFDWRPSYSHRGFFEKLAAACLTFRDAAWAADLYPWSSHLSLGISTASDILSARHRRAVWLTPDKDSHPIARFYDRWGSAHRTEELLPDLSETTLMTLAEWVRGVPG